MIITSVISVFWYITAYYWAVILIKVLNLKFLQHLEVTPSNNRMMWLYM